MILVWFLIILMGGGLLAWLVSQWSEEATKWVCLLALSIPFVMSISYWVSSGFPISPSTGETWLTHFQTEWISYFGISFNLGMDGLSLLMIILTMFLGILAVLVSWTEIEEYVGFYYFNLMFILAGIVGVFVALDLFLFYFFWEVMLIPMYFLIGIWGHENRLYAAYKFFIFTQASGLLMLLAILGLHFVHFQATGVHTFDYNILLDTSMSQAVAYPLMLGFLIAFIVKLPAFPFHSWLPDAHTEAPTAGSVILAGLLLKTGAYGILRFVIPMFPDVAIDFAPIAMVLGVIGILYGAKLAFAQDDLKRLVAYSSVSHMGFVLVGAFAFNELALQGVVMQMITHGISTGALFIIVGILQERIHTRDVNRMGGLWSQVPWMGGIGLVFVMASLGLPGLGNFIAEFLTLVGAYQADVLIAVLASLGLVFSTVYSLRIMQRVFYGEKQEEWTLKDLNPREGIILGALTVAIVALGFYPQPVLDTSEGSLQKVRERLPQSITDKENKTIEENNKTITWEEAKRIPNTKIKSVNQ